MIKGKFHQSNQILKELFSLYDPSIFISAELSPSGDVKIGLDCWASISFCITGYVEQATAITETHLNMVHQFKNPKTLYVIHIWGFLQKMEAREWEDAKQILEKYLPSIKAFGEPFFLMATETWYSIAKGILGDPNALEKALENFEKGLQMGATVFYCFKGSFIAELYLRLGKFEEGLRWIERMLVQGNQSSTHMHTAELYRLQGLCYLALKKPIAEVEIYFHKAIQLSQQQGAKLFELRATINLAALYEGHEKEGEQLAQLAKVYDWFTEGFDAVDLQEAKAVLDRRI